MGITDFEPDQNFGAFEDGVALANDEGGHLLVNLEEADEFDPRISDDVEGLLFLGYLTQSVTIYNHTFVLKTLRRGERLAVTQFARDYEDTLGIADALQTGYLALAIVTADGRPLSIAISDEERDPLVRLEANYRVVSRWFDPVLEALYSEYTFLLQRQNAAFAELEGKSAAGRRTPQP